MIGRTRGPAQVRRSMAVLALVTALGSGLLPVLPAAAGVPDQGSGSAAPTAGPCSSTEFAGSKLLTVGESRQSFVPTQPGLEYVELCISSLIGILGTDFTVNIYAGESSLTSPGPPIASVPTDAGNGFLTAQWVRVPMPPELATTPGATYVIGVDPAGGPTSSLSFQWRATCNDSLLTSCAGEPDRYAAGRANDLPANADYGFRTFGLDDADLRGEVDIPPIVCPGEDLAPRATASVTNDGARAVGTFVTDWVWSTDAALDAGDRVLPGSTTVPGLSAGATASIPPPVIPGDIAHGDGHLLLHLDVDDQVVEVADLNNLVAGPTTVTACGQPAFDGVDVTVVEPTVPTGFHQRQLDDLDPAALASLPQSIEEALVGPAVSPNQLAPNQLSPNQLANTALAPNQLAPNQLAPNQLAPNQLASSGLGENGFSAATNVRLADVLDDLGPSLAEQTLVANVPIIGPDWTQRLGPLTDEPIQNVSLARALALLPELTLAEVDINSIVNASWLALATANGVLDDLAPPAGQTWCGFLATRSFSCSGTGFDPATMSLLNLEWRGFSTLDLPFGVAAISTADTTSFLARTFPLTGRPRFNLEHTRLGQLPVDEATTNPAAIARCDQYDCSSTFVELLAAGALRDVTLGKLLDALSPAGRAGMTVGDLGLGTASVSSLRLSNANWNVASSYQIDNACPRMNYRVAGENTGSAAAIDPTIEVTLPAGFVYTPGSVALLHDGQAAASQAEPGATVSPTGVRTYRFELDTTIVGPFELRFEACASLYLGLVAAGTAVLDGEGRDGPYRSAPGGPADQVRVTERTPTPTTTRVTSAENLVIADHISEAGSFDRVATAISTTPRTLYKAQLWVPPGADYDLLAFGPATSGDAFNADGFAPNQLSPNQLAPNQLAPNQLAPNQLSPNQLAPNQLAPNQLSPNQLAPNGGTYGAQPDLLSDIPIQELRPSPTSMYAVSANRGDAPETLYWYSNFGDTGDITFAVADYNGTRDDAPYFLTVQVVNPIADPRLATCQAAPFTALTVPSTSAPVQSSVTNPRTLFITNRQVSNSVHGTTQTDAGVAALQSLASRTEIRGIVVDLGLNRNAAIAYNTWRTRWCDPQAANAVASHVRSLILDYRTQWPSIDTIVIAGGDEIVPDYRLPGVETLGNESNYVTPLLNATGGNNALVAAFAAGTITSADPYGALGPISVGTTFAFPPSAGVSRLPEAPSAWVAQRDQYVASSGTLARGDAMVSAYDGMVDGGDAAADVLSGAGIPTRRLTDTEGPWTAADFRDEAFTRSPDIAGYNGHANHWTLLSDSGSDTRNLGDFVGSSEASGIPIGSIVFSNGCHFGTAVPDALNRPPNTAAEATRLLDWSQAITQRRAIAVANTGFGIFDTIAVGQGERLQELFTQELVAAPNAAIALARAKVTFFATAGVLDPITYKSVHQLQLFGLGSFTLQGVNREQVAPVRPPATSSTTVSSGPYAVAPAGTTTCTDCYIRRETENGTAIDLIDSVNPTTHTAVNGRFSAPLWYSRIPLPLDRVSAGLWINDVQYQRLADIDPVLTRAALSSPDREPEAQYRSVFPTTLGQVADVGGESVVTFAQAVGYSNTLVDGQVRADVYVATSMRGEVFYRAVGTTGCTPHIDEVTLIEPEGSAFDVVDVLADEAVCGVNVRAAVIAQRADGSTTYVELGKGANGHWSGSVPEGTVHLYAQVYNGRGVGTWFNKGDVILGEPGFTDGVAINLTGASANGVYTGPVQGSLAVAPDASCQLFDNDHLVRSEQNPDGNYLDGQPFTIAGDGSHELKALCSDASSAQRNIAIDASAPVVTIITPTAGGTYAFGQVVPFDVIASDSGTGASCTFTNDTFPIDDGDPIRTGTTGAHTIQGSCIDRVGNVRSVSVSYSVTSRYTISTFMSPIAAKPTLNQVSKNSNITVKFTVTDSTTGQQTTDVSIIQSRLWHPIHCSNKTRTGAPPFSTAGTNPEYSGGTFHFNINAPSPAGNCYELVVTLVDGTTQSAFFKTKN